MTGPGRSRVAGGVAVVALWAGVCGLVPAGLVPTVVPPAAAPAVPGTPVPAGLSVTDPVPPGAVVPDPGPQARWTGPFPTTAAEPDARAETAVRFALAQIGLPYVWGGNGPAGGHAGFDCSGLTTAAFAAAGIRLPRTAHTQFLAGPRLLPGTPLRRGDLVFYGTADRVHHVGLYVGDGIMVNAPTFGRPVQLARVRYAGDDFVGAARPATDGPVGTATIPVPSGGGTAAPGGTTFLAPQVPVAAAPPRIVGDLRAGAPAGPPPAPAPVVTPPAGPPRAPGPPPGPTPAPAVVPPPATVPPAATAQPPAGPPAPGTVPPAATPPATTPPATTPPATTTPPPATTLPPSTPSPTSSTTPSTAPAGTAPAPDGPATRAATPTGPPTAPAPLG